MLEPGQYTAPKNVLRMNAVTCSFSLINTWLKPGDPKTFRVEETVKRFPSGAGDCVTGLQSGVNETTAERNVRNRAVLSCLPFNRDSARLHSTRALGRILAPSQSGIRKQFWSRSLQK